MTDMKYEPQPSGFGEGWVEMFFPLHIVFDVLITGFAVIGFLSALWRRSTVAAWLGIYGVILAIGVFVARESLPIIGLLWNPRVLPFLYLVRYMLMMIGIYEAIVAVGRYVSLERAAARVAKSGEEQTLGPSLRGRLSFNVATAIAVSFVCISIIGFRFQELPFASVRTLEDGSQRYGLGPISVPAGNDGFVDGWARWNFTGYEGKNAYGEYRALIETMKQIGEDPRYGCGRALWENNGETNKYGTTMGLMLLPHWTDGCIASHGRPILRGVSNHAVPLPLGGGDEQEQFEPRARTALRRQQRRGQRADDAETGHQVPDGVHRGSEVAGRHAQ